MTQADNIIIRASSTPRAFGCPGSVLLERDAPERPESDDARQGTAAHEVGEMLLTDQIGSADEMVDRPVSNGVIVDSDMAHFVPVYTNYVNGIVERCGPLAIKQVESSVRFSVGNIIITGTSDCLVYDPNNKTLCVIDFKYGYKLVEPTGNWQLISYALGAITRAPADWDIQTVEMTIVQPRPIHREGPIRTWVTTRDDLEQYRHTIQKIGEMIQSDPPPCYSGVYCGNCTGAATCTTLAQSSWNGVDVAGQGIPHEPTGPELAHELNVLQAAKQALENRESAIREMAEDRIKQGKVVPGWATEQKFGNTKWLDSIDIHVVECVTGCKLTDEKPVTPAEAKRRGVDDEAIKPFTERPSRGFKLVRRDADQAARELFGSMQDL